MDARTIATRYIGAWNRSDPKLRAKEVSALFAPDARYVEPLADVVGTEAITELVGQVQSQALGAAFCLAGRPDGDNQELRFAWGLTQDGAPRPSVAGFDVVVTDSQDRIALVLGFLDRVQA